MNDDDMNGGQPNDYGNEEFDGNMNDGMGDDGDMGGMDMNNNGDGNGGDDPDVDQYFDDAGDIGYLPADHVTTKFSKWIQSIFTYHSC